MLSIQSSLKFQNLEAKTSRHQKLICILDTIDLRGLIRALEEVRGNRGIGAWGKIPSEYSFYRFMRRLSQEPCQQALGQMFEKLVLRLKEVLPGFGEHLVGDSTKLHSYARGTRVSVDQDASWKKQKKVMKDASGNRTESFEKWFGFKRHLLADATYELPVEFVTTTAKHNDNTVFPTLWEKTKSEQPWILTDTNYMGLDMGYDDGKIYECLAIADDIIPIIKMRDMVREQNKDIDLSAPPVCENNLVLKFDGYESKRKQKKEKKRFKNVQKFSLTHP